MALFTKDNHPSPAGKAQPKAMAAEEMGKGEPMMKAKPMHKKVGGQFNLPRTTKPVKK